ncbi:MAG TPA: ABC transporter permease, partial [Gemmatimonadaceae bacterium]|nr:ABC transporter permease [Gemmatimonadaceae bacterium]
LALQTIRAQKLKSFFTLLGVTIGVMFLIAVVSIVGGMGRYMEQDVVGKIMGVNSFELRRRPNINMGDVTDETIREWRSRPRIRDYDVEPVVAALPAGVTWAVESEDNVTASSRYALKPRQVMAFTVSSGYFTIKKMGATSGRLFTPQEEERGDPVVVIGEDVKTHFFPGLDPVGRELKIGGLPYTVVGVAEKQGSALGISFDKIVIAPHNSRLRRMLNPHGAIDGIMVQAATPGAMTDAMERVRQVMRGRHKLRPSQPDNFTLETSESALEFWNKLKRILVYAGIALPAIGLVVGAIVIMNIMLVAVAERTREIGIRKSLGARRRDIMSQFLVESATLSTVGAALGVITGFAFAKFIALVSPLPAAVELWSVLLGVSVGAGVGVIAGVYPANQASRLDPITALRAE